MADVILFHHAQGLTEGVHAFADALRAEGHVVTVPDLFDGATFATVEEGVAHAETKIGFDVIIDRGTAVADGLPSSLVYAGFSLGALPAQSLAQTRPGARGALLFHGGIPTSHFGDGTWPASVPLQVHAIPDDKYCDLESEVEPLIAAAPNAELFLYPAAGHLFTDSSLPVYDEASATQVLARTLAFLTRV
jgi:dienelactone hydrolase